jgi:hypothetical protein
MIEGERIKPRNLIPLLQMRSLQRRKDRKARFWLPLGVRHFEETVRSGSDTTPPFVANTVPSTFPSICPT